MESDAIMRMISERCERLLVIVSPAFFESSVNQFFLKFAQVAAIEQDKRKIIPVIYEKCILPSYLSIYWKLEYYRQSRYFNFWEKLRESIQMFPKHQIDRQTSAVTMPR